MDAILFPRPLLAAALAVLTGVPFGSPDAQPQAPVAAPVKLSVGTPLVRTLAAREQHEYLVSLNAGERASIAVAPKGIEVLIHLLDSGGAVLATFRASERVSPPVGAVTTNPAEYRVRITSRFPRVSAGSYEIRLEEIRPAGDADHQWFEAQRLSTKSSDAENAGNPKEALTLVQRAVELIEALPGRDDQQFVYLLTQTGDLQARLGNPVEGERNLQRAIELGDTLLGRDDPVTAYARSRLGRHYMLVVEDHARAEPLLEEGVAATERSLGPSHPSVANNIIPLALLHTIRRDFARAVPLLRRGLEITEATLDPNDFTYLAFLNNLGDAYVQMGDLDRAEPVTTRALQAIEQAFGPENIRVSNPLLNLGIIARERRDYDRAFAMLWRAHAIRAKALGERNPQTASILISIGNLHHAQGAYAEAMSTYRRALDVLETGAGPYHNLTMMTLANMSRTTAALGDAARALDYQRRVEEIIEKNIAINLSIGSERQKMAYFESTRHRTDRTISLHARYAPASVEAARLSALVILQRKGRILDTMTGSLAALRQRLAASDQAMLDELRATTTRLASLALGGPGRTPPDVYRTQLAEVEAKQEQLEAEISRRSAEFRAARPPVTLETVQAAIPAGAVLVEYVRYRPYLPKARTDAEAYEAPRYAAYVIAPHGVPRHVDIGTADTIERLVATLRHSLADPKRSVVKDHARALDRVAFEPVRRLVTGATRILVAPDGALHLVPFEALVDGEGRYAIETRAISYLTSGRDLLRMQVARASRGAPLIVANPAFGSPSPAVARVRRAPATRQSVTVARDLNSVYFAPLSNTLQEAQVIRSLFPDATVLSGAEATKEALVHARAPSILHIASHGFFLDEGAIENPLLRSGIALAGVNARSGVNEKGILTALEAASLDLWGTELVTLSACDTGVGEVRYGEGVYGLRRAIVLAGGETLLMTLWPVSDYITRQMMSAYYTNLKAARGRGDALREAQLQMLSRRGREHPFYWAGYIQVGAWGPLRSLPAR